MEYRISLTGDLGSGKSTVGKLIAAEKGCEIYSTGKICRKIAASRGIHDIKEMNLYMAEHPEIDKEIDNGLVALSERPGDLIVDSRMAWHFTAGTYKVYLSAAIDVTAERIFNDKRSEESYSSIEEMKKSNIERKRSENARYLEMYGVDIFDMTNYDLVVDTTAAAPSEAAEKIIAGCEDRLNNNAYLYPPRLLPTLTERDCSGTVTVCCYKNNFYILTGHNAVMSAIRDNSVFISCKLVKPSETAKFDNYRRSEHREWFDELHRLGRREFTMY